MELTERVIWWLFGLLVAFVLVTLCFLILAIDHLEAWRDRRKVRAASTREGDSSRP